MKKTILTIVFGLVTVITFAQENTRVPQKNISTPYVVLRITNEISTGDLELELINNFYKIELADLAIAEETGYTEVDFNTKNDESYHLILDVTVRTTNDMRSAIESTEEFVG